LRESKNLENNEELHMPARLGEMSPSDVGLVLGTLLNAAAECEAAAHRAAHQAPDFSRSMVARARALVDVAERFEMTALDDLMMVDVI
jgi:hypothetical protein